jgi:hypothetical protein
MPVLVTADVPGQTLEGYEFIRQNLEPVMKHSTGFVLHTAHEIDGGVRIVEIWDSAHDANDFFAKAVHPNLPPGIRPQRKIVEVSGLITP